VAGKAGDGGEGHLEAAAHVAHTTLSASTAAVVYNVNSVLAMVDAAIEADKVCAGHVVVLAVACM
jgi:hypothetical protein